MFENYIRLVTDDGVATTHDDQTFSTFHIDFNKINLDFSWNNIVQSLHANLYFLTGFVRNEEFPRIQTAECEEVRNVHNRLLSLISIPNQEFIITPRRAGGG